MTLHPYVRRTAHAFGVAAIATGAVAAPAAAADEDPRQDPPSGRHGVRPPRRLRLPTRAHPRRIRPGDQARRRLHRARPRQHQGRRAGRPARERDQRHDRRRRPPRVRAAQDHQDHRRQRRDRLVHRGLHPQGAQDAAGQGAAAGRAARQHPVRRSLRDPDVRRGPRARQLREPQARPGDRRRAGDQAPDVLPVDRTPAGEAAPAFADQGRPQLTARQGRHPVVRDCPTCGSSPGRPASRSSS